MPFETFPRRAVPLSEPTAVFETTGALRLNAAAHDLIDRARHVELLFAYEGRLRLLALRPTDAENGGGYGSSTGLVSVSGLFRAHGIRKPPGPVRVDVAFQDGMLVVEVPEVWPEVSARSRGVPGGGG